MEVILHTKMVMIRKSMENLMGEIKTAWGNEKKQHTMEGLKKSAKLLRFENNVLRTYIMYLTKEILIYTNSYAF